MAFAAYLPENAILVLSLGGAFSPFFKAPPWGFCINRPAPRWGRAAVVCQEKIILPEAWEK